ncbi:MAG: hypothetical protein AAF299_12205 [Pseudomonadota bacterium]
MEQRERELSAAEKQRYFPRIDWSEQLVVFAGGAIIVGGLVALPVFIVWRSLFAHGPYQWLPWLPLDGSFVIWWVGLPVALLVFAATYCRDLLWQFKRKWSACKSAIVERHHIVDAIMVREWSYGTPAYFVLSDDGRVFFSNRGSDIYDDGWEADPLSVNKPDRVRRTYERIVNPNTLAELDAVFSGAAIAPDKCYTTEMRWDRIDQNPEVGWDDIIEKFKLELVETGDQGFFDNCTRD